MKIAFLSFYSGQVYRGAEVYVHELCTRLTKLGHEASIYRDITSNVDPKTRIVISTNGRWDAVLSKIWCLMHGAKLIISGQSGFGWDDLLNLAIFPDTFVGLTDYQCLWAKNFNPWVKVVKIPNGVDLNKFNPAVKPLKLNLKKPIVLNVGAMTPSKSGEISKRQDLLIKAVNKTNASLLLVGQGTGSNFAHDDMPKVYTACDLFSYPTSPLESFGISLLEAMASGLPVVATDDPIRREIVGDAGLFVDPTDTDAYSRALTLALSTDWGKRPRRQAEKFSWDTIARQYDQLISSYYR